MPVTPKVLGQLSASAPTTLEDVYTVPALTKTTVSTFTVVNRGATQETFRVSVAVAGAADNVKQYVAYDVPVPANDIFGATIGMTLGPADVVRFYASSTNLNINVFGIEET